MPSGPVRALLLRLQHLLAEDSVVFPVVLALEDRDHLPREGCDLARHKPKHGGPRLGRQRQGKIRHCMDSGKPDGGTSRDVGSASRTEAAYDRGASGKPYPSNHSTALISSSPTIVPRAEFLPQPTTT